MAQGIVGSLFGLPQGFANQAMQPAQSMQQLQAQMIGNATQGLQQGVSRMFGVVPPQEKLQQIIQQASQQVDLGTPEGMSRLADALAQHPEFAGMSMGLKQEANNMRMKQAEFGAEQQLGKARLDLTKAQTEYYGRRGQEKTSTEKGRQVQELIDMGTPQEEAVRMVYGSAKEANVSEQVKKVKWDEFQRQFPNDIGKAAQAFKEWETTFAKQVAAAGAPPSGAVPITNIATAQGVINNLIKGPKDRLSTVKDVVTQLNLAKKGVGAALPQLQRQLVKLVGDSQIGQGEVRNVLGSEGIIGDTINLVNQFMTGLPTKDKLDAVEQVVKALENSYASSYNSGRKQAEVLLNEANFSPETRKNLLPPEYNTTTRPSKTNFVEGQVYVDAKGNKARYVNGTWVPVQ